MTYKNLNKNYNPTANQGISTNLPIEPIQNVDLTKKTMRIFGDYFDKQVTVNSNEFDAVKSFFGILPHQYHISQYFHSTSFFLFVSSLFSFSS